MNEVNKLNLHKQVQQNVKTQNLSA